MSILAFCQLRRFWDIAVHQLGIPYCLRQSGGKHHYHQGHDNRKYGAHRQHNQRLGTAASQQPYLQKSNVVD